MPRTLLAAYVLSLITQLFAEYTFTSNKAVGLDDTVVDKLLIKTLDGIELQNVLYHKLPTPEQSKDQEEWLFFSIQFVAKGGSGDIVNTFFQR
eukprot:GAHX01003576.1.p2 GENE.GAHX01003576.1~~GAHX01003576.1.p2  ORF type:complete len:93 (-),score=21.22 GAHX01003576.1:119-397(-)